MSCSFGVPFPPPRDVAVREMSFKNAFRDSTTSPEKIAHPGGRWHPIPCVHHGEAIRDKANEDAGEFLSETYALLWHT